MVSNISNQEIIFYFSVLRENDNSMRNKMIWLSKVIKILCGSDIVQISLRLFDQSLWIQVLFITSLDNLTKWTPSDYWYIIKIS